MELTAVQELEAHISFLTAQLDYIEAMLRSMPTRSLLDVGGWWWAAGAAFVAFVFGWGAGNGYVVWRTAGGRRPAAGAVTRAQGEDE